MASRWWQKASPSPEEWTRIKAYLNENHGKEWRQMFEFGQIGAVTASAAEPVQLQPPVLIGGQVLDAVETVPVGTVIGQVATSGGGASSFTITAGATNLFTIDSLGRVSIIAALDYETATGYTLTVRVDNGAGSDTGTVLVNVVDVAGPVVAPGQSFSAPESAAVGDPIGTVSVSGEASAFSIVSASADSIGPNIFNGSMSVIKAPWVDNGGGSYTIDGSQGSTVANLRYNNQVTPGAVMAVRVTVSGYVGDGDTEFLDIHYGDYLEPIGKVAADGTRIIILDADTDDLYIQARGGFAGTVVLEYLAELVPTSMPSPPFAIDSAGNLTVSGALDFESFVGVTLSVQAASGSEVGDVGDVYVQVQDQGVTVSAGQSFLTDNGAAVGAVVGTVQTAGDVPATFTIGDASAPGANQISNERFDSDLSGWTNQDNYWQFSTGRAHHPSGNLMKKLYQAVALSIGDQVEVTFDYEVVAGTLRSQFRQADGSLPNDGTGSSHQYTGTGTATWSITIGELMTDYETFSFMRNADEPTAFYVDNVSVRVNGVQSGLFAISNTGEITVASALQDNTTHTVPVTATDGTTGATESVTITTQGAVIEPPVGDEITVPVWDAFLNSHQKPLSAHPGANPRNYVSQLSAISPTSIWLPQTGTFQILNTIDQAVVANDDSALDVPFIWRCKAVGGNAQARLEKVLPTHSYARLDVDLKDEAGSPRLFLIINDIDNDNCIRVGLQTNGWFEVQKVVAGQVSNVVTGTGGLATDTRHAIEMDWNDDVVTIHVDNVELASFTIAETGLPVYRKVGIRSHATESGFRDLIVSPGVTINRRYIRASGGDSNPGASPDQPWETIAKVNGQTGSNGAGYRYCFRRGEKFNDTTLTVNGGGTGSAWEAINFLQFDSYDPLVQDSQFEIDRTDNLNTATWIAEANGEYRAAGRGKQYGMVIEGGVQLPGSSYGSRARIINPENAPDDLDPPMPGALDDGTYYDDSNNVNGGGSIWYKPTSGTPGDHDLRYVQPVKAADLSSSAGRVEIRNLRAVGAANHRGAIEIGGASFVRTIDCTTKFGRGGIVYGSASGSDCEILFCEAMGMTWRAIGSTGTATSTAYHRALMFGNWIHDNFWHPFAGGDHEVHMNGPDDTFAIFEYNLCRHNSYRDEYSSYLIISYGTEPDDWGAGQSYAIGDEVDHNSVYYTATSAGTSGSNAPVHTSGTASDGGVNWQYQNRYPNGAYDKHSGGYHPGGSSDDSAQDCHTRNCVFDKAKGQYAVCSALNSNAVRIEFYNNIMARGGRNPQGRRGRYTAMLAVSQAEYNSESKFRWNAIDAWDQAAWDTTDATLFAVRVKGSGDVTLECKYNVVSNAYGQWLARVYDTGGGAANVDSDRNVFHRSGGDMSKGAKYGSTNTTFANMANGWGPSGDLDANSRYGDPLLDAMYKPGAGSNAFGLGVDAEHPTKLDIGMYQRTNNTAGPWN